MFLKDKFYKVTKEEKNDTGATYTVAILPDCNVYDGHFPGNPVCPGVCNMELILECAMMLTGRQLHYSAIKQCRLTAIATPEVSPEVTVSVSVDEGNTILAEIKDTKQTYMTLKGTVQ